MASTSDAGDKTPPKGYCKVCKESYDTSVASHRRSVGHHLNMHKRSKQRGKAARHVCALCKFTSNKISEYTAHATSAQHKLAELALLVTGDGGGGGASTPAVSQPSDKAAVGASSSQHSPSPRWLVMADGQAQLPRRDRPLLPPPAWIRWPLTAGAHVPLPATATPTPLLSIRFGDESEPACANQRAEVVSKNRAWHAWRQRTIDSICRMLAVPPAEREPFPAVEQFHNIRVYSSKYIPKRTRQLHQAVADMYAGGTLTKSAFLECVKRGSLPERSGDRRETDDTAKKPTTRRSSTKAASSEKTKSRPTKAASKRSSSSSRARVVMCASSAERGRALAEKRLRRLQSPPTADVVADTRTHWTAMASGVPQQQQRSLPSAPAAAAAAAPVITRGDTPQTDDGANSDRQSSLASARRTVSTSPDCEQMPVLKVEKTASTGEFESAAGNGRKRRATEQVEIAPYPQAAEAEAASATAKRPKSDGEERQSTSSVDAKANQCSESIIAANVSADGAHTAGKDDVTSESDAGDEIVSVSCAIESVNAMGAKLRDHMLATQTAARSVGALADCGAKQLHGMLKAVAGEYTALTAHLDNPKARVRLKRLMRQYVAAEKNARNVVSSLQSCDESLKAIEKQMHDDVAANKPKRSKCRLAD